MFSMFIWIKDWCACALECELESLVYSEQTLFVHRFIFRKHVTLNIDVFELNLNFINSI